MFYLPLIKILCDRGIIVYLRPLSGYSTGPKLRWGFMMPVLCTLHSGENSFTTYFICRSAALFCWSYRGCLQIQVTSHCVDKLFSDEIPIKGGEILTTSFLFCDFQVNFKFMILNKWIFNEFIKKGRVIGFHTFVTISECGQKLENFQEERLFYRTQVSWSDLCVWSL